MKVKLSLSKFCKDSGLIDNSSNLDDIKLELNGSIILDEAGIAQGVVVGVDIKNDTLVCELTGPLSDKISENYKKENNNA